MPVGNPIIRTTPAASLIACIAVFAAPLLLIAHILTLEA